jgi:hypothetical protein
MHANTPGTLSCRVSWTRRPHVPSIFRLPCMCSFPLSRGLEGHSRHRCAVPFILAHTPYSMMVQAPGERLWCSSHCPRTGTVCADHVVSGPFLRCAQKAMRSRQHRTPGPHASVRAALVHWLCMHRLHGFVSWASAPRARWSFGAAHRCWRTGTSWAFLRGRIYVACLPARSVMGLCPHHHCRGASTARAVSTVSPLPAHRQRRVPLSPHLCTVPAQSV